MPKIGLVWSGTTDLLCPLLRYQEVLHGDGRVGCVVSDGCFVYWDKNLSDKSEF